jgi:PPOX class probable F420-dependent enzyme
MGGRRLTDDETASLLNESKIAVVCSLNDEETIHAAPVWFGYIDEAIVFITPHNSRKADNIRRDNRVTILIEERSPPRGVMIYGHAEIDEDDPLPIAIEMTEKYMSPDKAKRFAEKGVTEWGLDRVIRVTLDKVITFHY